MIRSATNCATERPSAVPAEARHQNRKLMVYGTFTPQRSTTHPAGICSRAYDQKNAEFSRPLSVSESRNDRTKSGNARATERLDRER